jgi:hypothetical protein
LKRYAYDVVEDLKTELDFYLIAIPESVLYVILFFAIYHFFFFFFFFFWMFLITKFFANFASVHCFWARQNPRPL